MQRDVASWATTDIDRLITAGPCLLHSAIILASAAGGDAALYEGQDAVSGRRILTLKGTADQTRPVHFNPPLLLGRGLYVDVGSNVTEVFVSYTPLASDIT